MKRYLFILTIFSFLVLALLAPKISSASSLSINPATGSYAVGSTFEVTVMLDTKGKSINALQTFLTFPPDKLQVVSPSTGQSIIGVWTTAPEFNNSAGTITLEGGIPRGIVTSSGILTKITFRVKSPGTAAVKFLDKSKVFLNDGLATNDFEQSFNGVFQLRFPAPLGPIVASDTHPDQSTWYSSASAALRFTTPGADGFSYVFSNDPNTIPDNISEGPKDSIIYNNIADGISYFHIRALRAGVWGGVTHFILKTDTTPPAQFPVDVLPSARTTTRTPILRFTTTDASSGIDHYELKLEPLAPGVGENAYSFFIEAESPYLTPPLALSPYDAIVRAYDNAGNFTDITKRFTITTPFFQFIGDQGIQIRGLVLIPWKWVWIIGILLLLLLGYLAYRAWRWHNEIHHVHTEKKLPQDVTNQLAELKKYKEKYGKQTIAALLAVIGLWSLLTFNSVQAQIRTPQFTPPLITNVSRDISNREIFYIGGRTAKPNTGVVLYYENMQTGETFSQELMSDDENEWFYRHNTFLLPGEYLLWAQSKNGDEFSPPSSQIEMTVKESAIVFGANRLSYEAIYLFAVIVLLLLVAALVMFITYHLHQGKKKKQRFLREVGEAEESIRRGFAVLRRDIETELASVRQASNGAELSLDEKHREAELLNDLNSVQKRIGQEIWEMKKESW